MISVASGFVPLGGFSVVDVDYVKGGAMILADITARDAIPTARRKNGMQVKVLSTGLTYALGVDLTTWTAVAMSLATSFDAGLVKPDGETITVDLNGNLTALVPKFSTEGSVLASLNSEGETVLNMNWDGTITNWATLDTDDDASVVTIGMLRALAVIPP